MSHMEDRLRTLRTGSHLQKCLWNRIGNIQYNPGYLGHEENVSHFFKISVKRPSVMRTDFPEISHSDDPDKVSYVFIGMWIFLVVCNKTLLKCCRSKIRTWGIFYMPFGFFDVNREHVTPRNRHPFVDFCKYTLAAFGSKDCLHRRV